MDAPVATFPADIDPHEGEGFDLANLPPRLTGLPMVVWVSDGTGVRHDLRVKVSQTHGPRVRPDDFAVMSVRPEPQLLYGRLARADVETVSRWIALNEPTIVRYWQGELDTGELLDAIQRI